jgi:bacteriocin-type transport-associated protein
VQSSKIQNRNDMTEVLLKELTSRDIDWIVAAGHQQEIAAGTVLVREGKSADRLHILLEGSLSMTVPVAEKNPLTRAFAALEGGETLTKEIARLSSGEVIGDIPCLGFRSLATTIKAVERSVIMSIARDRLTQKLQQDVGFAARFYRAIAILFLERLQQAIEQLGRSNQVQGQPIKDVLFVLGELNDSDIDWMMTTGTPQKIAANTVIIDEGGPVDALYILLSGTMSVSVTENAYNPLVRAFAAIEGNEAPAREIARLSKGEIIGETPFIDARLPAATVKTLEDSLVLAIGRSHLAAKLQQDVGFACRFYKFVAALLCDRLSGMVSKFGYGRRVYTKGLQLDNTVEYEDELDINVLERIALAGNRFDWMLKHLTFS